MYKYLGNTDILLYDIINFISSFFVLGFNLSCYKQKKSFYSEVSANIIAKTVKKKRSDPQKIIPCVICSEIFIITVFQHGPIPMLNELAATVFNTGTNYFGALFLSPLFIFLICSIIKINPFKQLDLITPGYALALSVIKLACFCHGCCRGIEWSYGLYNSKTGLIEFPIQLIESGLAFLAFIFLSTLKKKVKEGTLFPIYIIFYSSTRFFSEFLRADPNVIWQLKKYHFLCIAGVIVGVTELIAIKKYKIRIDALFQELSVSLHNYIFKIATRNKKNIVHHKKRKKR